MHPCRRFVSYTTFFLQALMAGAIGRLTLEEIADRHTGFTAGSIHLPIVPLAKRRNFQVMDSVIGLGDAYDVMYSALIKIGGTTTPLMIDTGSSDLWVISDTCSEGCNGTAQPYRRIPLQSTGIDVRLAYGDSLSGTFASGLVGSDDVSLGTFNLKDQPFAVINRTNTTLIQYGLAGILGLGFPINSEIWPSLFRQQIESPTSSRRVVTNAGERPLVDSDSSLDSVDSRRSKFPSIQDIFRSKFRFKIRETETLSLLQSAFTSWSVLGPFLPRLVMQGLLTQPMVVVSLQRNSIDVGGNLGMLSIGELPAGINSLDLTWVPLRGYSSDIGGIPAPTDSPLEIYPLTWEIMIDSVYLDGEKLPLSTLAPSSIGLSALIDTGNSLIRGPSDVVSYIQQRLGPKGLFCCREPHVLSFEIGGKHFPVDPRDFAIPVDENRADLCSPNVVSTDPPQVGGFLFSWSLGVPFLKGVLSAYYFGNLTYPSRDPPKLGFLSTVPNDAQDLMKDAATTASMLGGFPSVSQVAPTRIPLAASTDSHGVPQATSSKFASRSTSDEICNRVCPALTSFWSSIFVLLMFGQWPG